MRSRYKFIEHGGTYFLTCTIVDWLPIFTSEPYFDIITNSLKFCQDHKDLKIFAYVILDNHFHLVAGHDGDLSDVIKSLKMFTAREIISNLAQNNKQWALHHLEFAKKRHKNRSRYQVWQEGSHPQLVNSEKMLVQKIEYVHKNPIKRGLVSKPEHWKYSSAGFYATGETGPLQLEELSVL